ncbi:hypothetical protein RJ640_011022 [Escallonia rubra]|uniref:Elongator complex protein 5 n=1 Tax=Escallonia rubra TaxID=112253 RepID=A0AA88RDE0_9ASTE|nr:hypothetical protein RJ640_011022 [Escallonia rubra]
MAESVSRALRDGALDGEHAPALAIKDSGDSPFGLAVFSHVLTQLASNVLAGKSQSRFVVLDCYTDPLGWKERLMECGSITNSSPKVSVNTSLCKDIRDLDKLFSLILQQGKGFLGEGKSRFSVAIDSEPGLSGRKAHGGGSLCLIDERADLDLMSNLSLGKVSEMLRHTSTSSVAGLISNLRSHNLVSCVFWLLHSDFHEIRVAAALEYLSSMLASIEQMTRPNDVPRDNSQNISLLEHNYRRGKFHVRFKRRNGRVRVMSEEFQVEQSRIKFMSVSSEDGTIAQSLVPKVQFNLQLSEKEKVDRAKVVLPFEHQGNGRSIDIYDGRRSLNDGKSDTMPASSEKVQTNEDSGRGEIIYFRDSDDEMPDSDEDPDDDLDI